MAFITDSKVLDAATTVFFNRELEHIISRTYDTKYAELSAMSLFAVNSEANPGDTSVVYRSFDQRGVANIIADYGKDLPRVDIGGKEVITPLREMGASFAYSHREIQSAQKVGRPLESRRASVCRRSIEELMNDIAWDGDAQSNLPGFFSNSDVASSTAVNGAAGTPQWSTKTPDEIIYDVNIVCSTIFKNSKGIHRPNQVWLDLQNWNYINSTPRASGSDQTIAGFIAANSPFITSLDAIKPVNEIENKGTSAVEVMVVSENNAENAELLIAEDTVFHPVQERGLEFLIQATAVFGGLQIRYPKAFYILENV